MDITTDKAKRDHATREALMTAQLAVMQLKSPQMDKVVVYLKVICENEMIRCSTQDDELILRRSQGKTAAIAALIDLLEFTPTTVQSAVVSKEV